MEMERLARKAFVLTAGVVLLMLVAGCEEQNKPEAQSPTRKDRLVAAENIQLKKDLEQRDEEIKRQKALLDKYMEENRALRENAQENTQKLLGEIMKSFIDESEKLRKENEELKAQIKELEK